MKRARHLPSQLACHRGATAVETAIVLAVFLVLVFGMLELGIAVFRYHVVSQGARQGARQAIVRGELAPPELSEWGPAEYGPQFGSADDEIAVAIRPYLTGLDLDRTTIQLSWPDGNTRIGSRVRVTVNTTHEPFVTFLFTTGWTLTGDSTMRIAH